LASLAVPGRWAWHALATDVLVEAREARTLVVDVGNGDSKSVQDARSANSGRTAGAAAVGAWRTNSVYWRGSGGTGLAVACESSVACRAACIAVRAEEIIGVAAHELPVGAGTGTTEGSEVASASQTFR
jgi:hypothetical protein